MRLKRHSIDLYLLFIIFALMGIGVLMIFSATAMKDVADPYYFLKRQLLWSILGCGALFFAANFDYHRLKKYSWLALPVSAFLLLVVLGTSAIKGSKSWISVGSMGFQPAELVKPALALLLAKILSTKGEKVHTLEGLMAPLLVIALICGLIMLQPDLGTTMVIAVSSCIILFIGGANIFHLGVLSAMGVSVVLAYALSDPIRSLRIFGFLNPEVDPLGINFQLTQSLYAIGSGGLMGVGLGQSHQKLGYLPEQHNDFIFSVIAEESGFIGGFFVILLFGLMIYRGYMIAKNSRDNFSSLLAAGITSFMMVEAMMNIAVVTGAMPVTGITLPLISYGGSSLLFKMLGLGILLNISRFSKREVVVVEEKAITSA